jgi:hypothetical protein
MFFWEVSGGVAVETRRRAILSGKRVLQRSEREQPSDSLFLCFLNYFNKIFSLSCYLAAKKSRFNFRLSFTLNEHVSAF